MFKESFNKHGLNDFLRFVTVDKKNLEQSVGISSRVFKDFAFISAAMLMFTVFSLVFTYLNKVSKNMKGYAVHMMTGAGFFRVLSLLIFEIFALVLAGNIIGFNVYYTYTSISQYHIKDDSYILGLKSALFINLGIMLLIVLITSFFVYFKMKSYSLSMLIRGNEVKKGGGISFYKAIMVFMFGVISVFIMMISSYFVKINTLDAYFNEFYSLNAIDVNVYQPDQMNYKEVESLDFATLGKDIMVNRVINQSYNSQLNPKVRGIYFNGDVELPPMLEGRFFTEEEANNSGEYYAVVGKNVYEDFGTESFGTKTFDFNGKTFIIIGIMGTEEITNLDNWAFISMPSAIEIFTYVGEYTIDGKDKNNINNAAELLKSQAMKVVAAETAVHQKNVKIDGPAKLLWLLFVIVIINACIFSFYYIERKKRQIAIKKFLGYGKSLIFSESFLDFLKIAVIGFVISNFLMTVLTATVLKNVGLFSLFSINIPILFFAFIGLALSAFIFSFIAISRAFNTDTSSIIR